MSGRSPGIRDPSPRRVAGKTTRQHLKLWMMVLVTDASPGAATPQDVLAWWYAKNGVVRSVGRVTSEMRREWNRAHPDRPFDVDRPLLPAVRPKGMSKKDWAKLQARVLASGNVRSRAPRKAYTGAPPTFVSGGLPSLGKGSR